MKKEKIIETSLNIPVTPEFVERRIHLIRGQKVMLDSDLAELYQVETKNLNKAVKRNIARFPGDFMFRLTKKEIQNLRFQIGTSSWGGGRYLPYVFTELGVAMLSSVLKGDRAVQMNIFIMRAFVKLRELLATHADLARKMEELEKEQKKQGDHLLAVSSVLKRLMDEGAKQKDAIGFLA
ncbi:MAG: ORF6N domain-containing protein [Candidatus Paceibacterota bacterium]